MSLPGSMLAYIDPNTGGMLFQILAAGFALFSGLILVFARQIRSGFAKIKRWVREHIGGDKDKSNNDV